MTQSFHVAPPSCRSAGFTLIELLVSMGILLVVSAGVTEGVMRMSMANRTVSNRAAMHAGVRNATELLQQEVGQAGRISLPGDVVTAVPVAAGAATVTLSSDAAGAATRGMFVGERLAIDHGAVSEVVTVTAINGNQITATFANAHLAGVRVSPTGGFASGVIPTTAVNGSTGVILKIFGDINDDRNMVYVEYSCDFAAGRLYRNSMAFDAAVKPEVTVEQVLLDNVEQNPGETPAEQDCFRYQEKNVQGVIFVVGVAITLTVRTAAADATSQLIQRETKALLNVAPRNVFSVWQMASLNQPEYVQRTPAATTALLAN